MIVTDGLGLAYCWRYRILTKVFHSKFKLLACFLTNMVADGIPTLLGFFSSLLLELLSLAQVLSPLFAV